MACEPKVLRSNHPTTGKGAGYVPKQIQQWYAILRLAKEDAAIARPGALEVRACMKECKTRPVLG